jgi:hypothetical protein
MPSYWGGVGECARFWKGECLWKVRFGRKRRRSEKQKALGYSFDSCANGVSSSRARSCVCAYYPLDYSDKMPIVHLSFMMYAYFLVKIVAKISETIVYHHLVSRTTKIPDPKRQEAKGGRAERANWWRIVEIPSTRGAIGT